MGALPVTIRLLDPPLHEFLPHSEEEIAEVAEAMGADPKKLADRAQRIARVQSDARLPRLPARHRLSGNRRDAGARHLRGRGRGRSRNTGKPVVPEIMVPLIATKAELDLVKASIDATAKTVAAETKRPVKYQVGTMIELPRAALKADEIAETAEFFSFGTNDLTQTAFGISRDDAASFLGIYTSKGILPADPFVSIDRDGVGELIRIAADARAQGAQEHQARHLRRARRRSGVGRLLPRDRARLRVVFAVPRAHRAPGRRPGRARQARWVGWVNDFLKAHCRKP